MRALIEGSEISSTKSFYVPSMLLSSYHPTGQGLVCRLEIPKSELLEVLQEPYDQLVKECDATVKRLARQIHLEKRAIHRW
jgi:hypothetical protein